MSTEAAIPYHSFASESQQQQQQQQQQQEEEQQLQQQQQQRRQDLRLITKEEYFEAVGKSSASEVKNGEAQMFWKISAPVPVRPDLTIPSFHITDHLPHIVVREFLKQPNPTIFMLIAAISDAYKEGYRPCYDPEKRKFIGPDISKEATIRVIKKQLEVKMNDENFLNELLQNLEGDAVEPYYAIGALTGKDFPRSKISAWLEKTARDRPKLDVNGQKRGPGRRPKASPKAAESNITDVPLIPEDAIAKARKPGRGRPKGSKNKPKGMSQTTGVNTNTSNAQTESFNAIAQPSNSLPAGSEPFASLHGPSEREGHPLSHVNYTGDSLFTAAPSATPPFPQVASPSPAPPAELDSPLATTQIPPKRPRGRPKGSTKDKSKIASSKSTDTTSATGIAIGTATANNGVQKKARKPGSGRPKGSWGWKKRETLAQLATGDANSAETGITESKTA